MKKFLLVAGTALLSMGANAQVGINVGDEAKGTLDVHYDTEWAKSNRAQGIIPPKMTTNQRNTMQDLVAGLMIYNTDYNCLQVYDGTYWKCSDGTEKEMPSIAGGATATLGEITPLRWIAMNYKGGYYSSPQGGIAPSANISVEIPYSNATNGIYRAYEQIFTLPDKYNTPRQFKLSYPMGKINSPTGTITATLTNISGVTYEPKAQPMDGQWRDLATPQVNFNGGSTTSLAIQAMSGIPDRCFGQTTRQCVGYGANVKEHDFVYVPITGPDGKTWLNNNLGADYANVNNSVFDPTRQATDPKDYHAYGSLFQWQRNPDGHELINWSASNSGSAKYGTTRTISNSWTNPNTNEFIDGDRIGRPSGEYYYSWVNIDLDEVGPFNLWQSNGTTNPCPQGYHVPTHNEQIALHNAIIGSNMGNSEYRSGYVWREKVMSFSASGWRDGRTGQFLYQGREGHYYSSSYYNDHYSWRFVFSRNNSSAGGKDTRAYGFGIRCIKN